MKRFLLVFALFAFLGFAAEAQTTAPKADKKEISAKEQQAPATKTTEKAEHKHDAKGACCADKAESKAAGCGSAAASAAPKSCCASKAAATEGKAMAPAEEKKSKKRRKE